MNLICQLVLAVALAFGGDGVAPTSVECTPTALPATAAAAVQAALECGELCCEPCSAICRWICEMLGCCGTACESTPAQCCPPGPCAPGAPPGCCKM